MFYLRADYSKSLNCDYSIFISFKYNPNYVNIIKTLPSQSRSWNNNEKEWEIDYSCYNQFIGILNNNHIPYNAEDFVKSINKLIEKVQQSQAIQKQDADVDSSILNDVTFKTKPYSYQLDGIAYGLEHDKFLLADQQGLGKSLQCLNIARLKRGGAHCLIIVGYSSLQWNWVREVETHTNETAHILGAKKVKTGATRIGSIPDRIDDLANIDDIDDFFIITSVATLRSCEKQSYLDKNGKTKYNRTYVFAELVEDLCRQGKIGRVIFDEIQVCKSPTTAQTEALLKIKSAPYLIAATGTPIMNRHIDLWPIMTWLKQENNNYFSFRDRYCKMGGFKGKQIVGDKNGPELNKRLSKFMLRRLKDDVLDLPEKIIIDEYLELDGRQWALYQKYSKLMKQKLYTMKGNKVELLSATLNLRKITELPCWLEDESCSENVKFERIAQLLDEITQNNEKAIIFSNWSTPVEHLLKFVSSYNPACITGSTEDRMEQVDKFQTDDSCKVIIGTIGAMGTGLTLTAASNVIFLDEPWNRALKDQATDRAHRIGTKKRVNVYTLICKDTIDEGVHKTVQRKGLVSDVAVDGVSIEELEKFLNGDFS